MNQAQKYGDEDVTCMSCKFYEVLGRQYCDLAEKENGLDNPAYDCPYFEYGEILMPKEVNDEIKKEEELRKQEDSAQKSNNGFAAIVAVFCLISTGFVVSHASSSLEVLFDIIIGAVITVVLVHLINH